MKTENNYSDNSKTSTHTIKGLLRTGTLNLDFKRHRTQFYLLHFFLNGLYLIPYTPLFRNWIPQNPAEVVAMSKPMEIVYAYISIPVLMCQVC